MKYLITGATGHLGSKILSEMRKLVSDKDIVAGVHTLSKAAHLKEQNLKIVQVDYFDRDSLVNALKNIDVFIYVPTKSHDSFTRITELEYVVKAARKSNVAHILAMGFIADQINDPFALSAFYGYLPRRLAESGVDYTIIRNALYADTLISQIPDFIKQENVFYPVGNKALSYIGLNDIAKAIAKVAVTSSLRQNEKVYTLTQEKNYTMSELAEILTKITGQKIGYKPVSLREYKDLNDEYGEGYILSSLYDAGSRGFLAEVSNDYRLIMGHQATSLEDFLSDNYT
ncbi:SDR family oxidoreductase [Companilactobacillus baiquanensis]|uniref:SDR family oxidoreductase n=1 Tax=Companilactobacillus baiquanensis TaxID=2486005 RepID=A0ABW1UVU9_9LACO|nr:SDR family oxidoreductase [Companilactobacillus baiquanensis]